VALGHIQSDPGKIDQFLPPVEDVEAILVGHAHYDHLMDIPYIAQKRAPKAQVFGSQTMKNILSAALPEGRLVALNSEAATFEKPGEWRYTAGKRIRFMAIRSEHAPHFFGIKLYSGEVFEKLDRLPKRAWGWKEGQTLAYLIDFMGEGGSIDFRIHYQDAASNPPLGFPPPFEPKDQKRVDVAIVCVPGFDQVKNYPEGIIQHIKPRFVILGHWEDFFRPRTEDPEDLQVVPLTDPSVFIARMKKVLPSDANWAMPRPGSWLQLKGDKF
jgi:L-ascorbate metabolism protein UlaG (beta-lactamase superfamily)